MSDKDQRVEMKYENNFSEDKTWSIVERKLFFRIFFSLQKKLFTL